MKKIIAFTAIATAAAALMASCTKVEINDVQNSTMRLTARMDDSSVKTTLSGTSVLWDEKDSISVFSASGSSKFKITSLSEDKKTGVFEGVAAASPVAALYPYTEKAVCEAGKISGVVIPAVQTAVEGSFANEINPAVAVAGESGDLAFKNIGALLSFSIAGDNIDWVTIEADTDIAGTADVTVAAEPVVTFTSGVKTVKLSGAFEKGKTYYAVVAPCTIGSLNFTFHKAAQGAEITATAKAAKALVRNGNYSFGTIATSGKWVNGIWDAADLIAFGAAVTAGSDISAYKDGEGVVNMWRDVDLGNVQRDSSIIGYAKFTQSSNIYDFTMTDGKPFEGIFDGHYKTVKGLNISKSVASNNHHMYGHGLFGGIKNATVRNLNVDGTGVYCQATNAKSAQGGLVAVAVSSTIENCTVSCTRIKGRIVKTNSTNHRNCYGGIAAIINDTEIKGCTNNSRIGCLNGKDDGTSYNNNNGADSGQMGGICGFASGNGTCKITDCVNNGQVGGYETKYVIGGGSRIGGIIGTPLRVIEITGCTNNGEVNGNNKYATDKSCYVGGISSISCLSTQVIKNCTNNGLVTYSIAEEGYNKGYCGGIIARNLNNPITIESCHNYGTVTSNAFGGKGASDSPVGIILGRTFGVSATITACTIGGKIGPLDETAQVEITSDNYTDYIYGWEAAKPATVTVENCQFGTK